MSIKEKIKRLATDPAATNGERAAAVEKLRGYGVPLDIVRIDPPSEIFLNHSSDISFVDYFDWLKRPVFINLAGLCWVFNLASLGFWFLSLADEKDYKYEFFYESLLAAKRGNKTH